MTSFSQPKKRRFSSIDSNIEINRNTNLESTNNTDINNNNLKIQNTICHLIDVISDNDLNFFYQDNNTSNFKHNIDQLNLKFYLETEKILSSPEGTYINDNKLFLILFKQINLYIREIERLNSILINQVKEPTFLKKRMVMISQKKDNLETKELLIQTLKNALKSLEKKLSKTIQSENILKEQNQKLKKEIKHYKELYENSMGISSIRISNSQNLKRKSKRTFSDNNTDNNNQNNNNNNINNKNATISVNNSSSINNQKKNSSSKLKIIKAVKNKISYKKYYNNLSNSNTINITNNINCNIGSNRSSNNITDENGNNKTQKISINITKVNKGYHYHSNSNNLPKSNHDISFSMNLNNNINYLNNKINDIENLQDLLIEIKDYLIDKCNNHNNNYIDFNTLLNENNNNANISFDKIEKKNLVQNSNYLNNKTEHKNYIIDVKPNIDQSNFENINLLTPHFSYSKNKLKEISRYNFDNGNNNNE